MTKDANGCSLVVYDGGPSLTIDDSPFTKLSDAVEDLQREMGTRFLPVLESICDTMMALIIKSRYQAANKRGLALALFIAGVVILCS